MDNMKTRAENRCNSINLLPHERLAQLFRLAHTQILEQLPMKIRRQSLMLVYVRRSGNWVGIRLNASTPAARRSDPRGAGECGSQGADNNTC
jgi:hypothetical protein